MFERFLSTRSCASASIRTPCPLPACQPAWKQSDKIVFANTPRFAQIRHARRRNAGGVKTRKIDAARDDGQPLRLPAVFARDMSCRPLRIGDHGIAAQHHRIVEALERVRSIVAVSY